MRAQVKDFGFSKLKVSKNNVGANSGASMYVDFLRMNFVINGKSIDKTSIELLMEKAWKQYSWTELRSSLADKKTYTYGKEFFSSEEQVSLLKKEAEKNNDYRPIAKEIFKEMFQYAKAAVPNDHILEELVTNCNQSSYHGGRLVTDVLVPALPSHKLEPESQGIIYINLYR